ncbi:hypothetical protein FKY79_13875 [Enterococcus faecalis]|nr:hypothetical protein [Enterococcus faecalis]MBO6389893.1 hypothetical protein [Enterococcus faecalis]MBO6397752.1 hypothetical protein [Enterococcus faecalis]MBO6461799.1 hypothetical protein [Enterococcus faecalis]PQE35540.1 hypothetical protein CUS33_09360 [Enterococcus faecalis]
MSSQSFYDRSLSSVPVSRYLLQYHSQSKRQGYMNSLRSPLSFLGVYDSFSAQQPTETYWRK